MCTKAESAFLESVAHYCGTLVVSPGVSPGCPECRDAHGFEDEYDDDTGEVTTTAEDKAQAAWESGEWCDEGGFSWSSCESCGSSLGGDRYAAHGIDPETSEVFHLDICVDCLCFHANGDTPTEWK